MAGQIIGCISCVLCALPFLLIARYQPRSGEPIAFWSGDESLRDRVRDLPAYNRAMSRLFRRLGLSFLFSGMMMLVWDLAGLILLGLTCTVGIYLVWRGYRRALAAYA